MGGGNNGKSVFTKLMKALHGDDVSTTSMATLAASPYGAYDLLDKDINLDEELPNMTLQDTARLKKLTGNQHTRVEGKMESGI
ncbi:MAG TPA: DUF5906 domain-containing protein [Candidatus Nitrosopolaris sp.]|nr:DUF5906 domain-containing protein [Candidatus Nitrosopolaris sp.]